MDKKKIFKLVLVIALITLVVVATKASFPDELPGL